MRRYFHQHKTIAAISAFGLSLVLWWLWSLSAPVRGYIAAHIDVHRGRYQELGYGLPPPSRSEYARCLRERYNIEFRPVAGCVVSESLVSYVNSYDSVVAEVASRKFAHDVFKECAGEAERKWTASEKQHQTRPAHESSER